MRVLIAEDDNATRKLLETYLNKWGYEVTSASDGNQAWEILQSPDAPHLLILDWVMPGMHGIDICRKIRTMDTGGLKHIILLTAKGDKEDLVAGFEAGANDYIKKHFDNDELRARIEVGARVVELQTALAKRVKELEEAISHIKTLQGVLPICMHCHKIRNDKEIWQRLEEYIQGHSQAMLSHGLCPECYEKYYSEYTNNKNKSSS